MKRSLSQIVIVLLAAGAASAPFGCTLDPATLVSDSAVHASLAPGMYWVEGTGDVLNAYRLPEQRGDAGQWLAIEGTAPAWYTGPAVYRLADDAAWSRETQGDDLTLDDVLQLWDPSPRSPANPS